MLKRFALGLSAVLVVVCVTPRAQEREDRTLLSHAQMRAIINEASGERAMHHVLELVPYPRIRPTSEYQAHFRESEVMAGFAKEYGFSTVEHYGSSDHVTYMQHGIPALMFITWPDNWYHSSQDTPDKQDSTQYKRAAVVATGAMAVLATGGDEMAVRVVSENLARGAERMGDSHRKGLAYMADVTDAGALATAYREASIAIRHQAGVEKGVVRSARTLFENPAAGEKNVQVFEPLIDKRAAALLDEVKAAYTLQAAQRKTPAAEPAMTAEEKDASALLVECVHGSSFSGCSAAPGAGGGRGGFGGGGGGGGGRGQATGLPQHMNAEAAILLGQKKTALEIRDFLSGEFEPVPLADVMRFLRAREQAGAIRLVRRP